MIKNLVSSHKKKNLMDIIKTIVKIEVIKPLNIPYKVLAWNLLFASRLKRGKSSQKLG